MSLTLNHQMNTVFRNGLGLVRKHQQPILKEWQSILVYLRKAGKRSEKNAEETIAFFSKFLFSPDGQTNEVRYPSVHTEMSFQPNQFIITLLENAVHDVVQKHAKRSQQNYQAVQYLFSTISEQVLAHPYQDPFSVEGFLKHLVTSQQLPIEWAATIVQEEQSFMVKNGSITTQTTS